MKDNNVVDTVGSGECKPKKEETLTESLFASQKKYMTFHILQACRNGKVATDAKQRKA